jgi:hypothetical protein
MECDRLKKLVRNWYVQVQDEAMAPARMVDFMRNHVAGCLTCMADPLNEIEIKRITEIVLPPTKIPKAIRKESDDLEPGDKDGDDSVEDDAAEDDDDVEDVDPAEEDDEEEDEDDEI